MDYSNDTGEISAFTSGDFNNDGNTDYYFGTRLGLIIHIEESIDSEYGSPSILNDTINNTITEMEYWKPSGAVYPLLIVGTQEGIDLYFAENGSIRAGHGGEYA